MNSVVRIYDGWILLAVVAVSTMCLLSDPSIWHPVLVVGTIAFAISLRFSKSFRGYQFTAWIIAVVAAAMIYPQNFLHVGGFDMKNKWVMLIAIQLVMFGMGVHMTLRDFAGVVKSPRGVFVGIFCHFTVMPLVGLALTKIFHFEPEIAAGIILIGSCSSGLASNVMAYIAKSNLALSVTVTAVTTLIAPLMTPLWMKLLAGEMVEVSFFKMMVDIIKIVLVPIAAALIHDYLKVTESKNSHLTPALSPPSEGAERGEIAGAFGRQAVFGLTLVALVWLAFLIAGGWEFLQKQFSPDVLTGISLGGFLLGAFVIGVVYHALTKRLAWLDGLMPTLSIVGILYVTAMTTAAGNENLRKVGWLLLLACALHNTAGFFFGYWLSRAAGLDINSARSVAFEVGLQNGGMASGLATAMGKLATVGLAAACFIPWMNISGSVLANYWAKRPAKN
jgi:BASS family bile acid:Na+ symporter